MNRNPSRVDDISPSRRRALVLHPHPNDDITPLVKALFDTVSTCSVDEGLSALRRNTPALVVVDTMVRESGAGVVCRAAKQIVPTAAVLVTTADIAAVPAMIAAGCDSVLVHPFSPNLLFTRLGRLFPARLEDGAVRACHGFVPTNRIWEASCPTCGRSGIVSFDAVGIRRWWFACTGCAHTWIGPEVPGRAIGVRPHESCVSQDRQPRNLEATRNPTSRNTSISNSL